MTSPLSISEARRLLPRLVERLSRHPDEVIQISVRNRLVAELKAATPLAKKGLAAGHLLALARRARRTNKKGMNVSTDVDSHLYE